MLKVSYVANCTICNSTLTDDLPVIETKDPFKVVDQSFNYYKCSSCSGFILNPRPELDEMSKFYEEDFLFKETDSKKANIIDKISASIQNYNMISEVAFTSRHLNENDKYLDYSAGNGQILSLIRKRNPNCEFYATEFSRVYREYLRTSLDVNSIKKELSDFEESKKFNLISLFGVLEHVQEPNNLIQELLNRLEKGGKIVITVPNVNAFQRFIFGTKWYSWIAPRHWQMFNIHNLKGIVQKNGLEVIDEKHFFLRTCSATLVLSIFPSLDPLRNQRKISLILYGILFYFFIPFELFASAFKRSGFMGIVAKRI